MVIKTFCFNIVGDIVPPRDLKKKKNKTDFRLIYDFYLSAYHHLPTSISEGLYIITNNHIHYSDHKLHFFFTLPEPHFFIPVPVRTIWLNAFMQLDFILLVFFVSKQRCHWT